MAYIRKFKPGKPYRSFDALVRDLMLGRYIYMHHKPQHPRWVRSMTLQTVMGFFNYGNLKRAIRTEGHNE